MKKWVLSILFVAILTVVAVWAVGQLVKPTQAQQPKMLVAAAVPMVVATPSVKKDMQSQLMDPGLDLKSREMAIEKIEIEKRLDDIQKLGEANPAPKIQKKQAAAGAIPAQLQVETGIFEGSEGMIRPSQATILNYWRGVVNGKILMAFAGAKANAEQKGMVILMVTSLDPAVSDTVFETYVDPAQRGHLRVVDAKDGILSLQRANGDLIKFDLNKKTFEQ